MPDYSGVTWRVNYGEISERLQFRVGYVNQTTFEAYFEVDQLNDLISVMNAVQGLSPGVIAKGSTLQARNVTDGFNLRVIIEPLSDTFPPSTMSLLDSTRADLIYALSLFQTRLPGERYPDDWDFSKFGPVFPGSPFDQQLQRAIDTPGTALSGLSAGDGGVLLHAITVAGVQTVAVLHEHTYELNATAAATVSLSGLPGCQAAIVWSGAAGTLEGTVTAAGETYVAVRLTAGWKIYTVGASGGTGGDTTTPTPGTIAGSAISSAGFTLTISGASDAYGLHATPYAFSTDNGATWSAYQAGASLAITGKTASTGYQCKGRVRDAAGNTADTPAQTVTTTSAGATWQTVAKDSFNGTDGTALTAHTSETGGVTYTGSQAGPKILSNKVDIYPYGGDQNAKSSLTTGLGGVWRASLGYAIPNENEGSLLLTVTGGVSAAAGAGQFNVQTKLAFGANTSYATITATSTYDGALTVSPVGGHDITKAPKTATFGISMSGGVLSATIDGVVWATIAPAAGCTFGSSSGWEANPDNWYNATHWTLDNYLVEKYA